MRDEERNKAELIAEVEALRRKNAAYQETQQALQASEKKFRMLFERSIDGILLLDGDVFIDCNEATMKMMRCTNKAELLSLHPWQLSPERQPDGRPSREKASEIIPLALEKGFHRFEWTHRRLDGEDFSVEVTLVAVPMDERQILYTTWRDLTRRKETEAERERLQQELIEAQQRAIQELSTPIIPLLDDIIILPLIGSIDTRRARDILRSLLDGIDRHQARVVIIDITGVSVVDTGVALHLNKAIKAARLKGAEVMITGITNAVAETIVELGVEWEQYQTYRNLQTAVKKVIRE
jgi:PAS domain S-box-containing protein